MRPQRLDCAEVPGELRLGERCVYLVVTNLVQPHDRAALAAFELGNKVVQALPGLGGDGSVAQGADRI